MVEVYYYIPPGDAEDAVECGLKLSKWFNREVRINSDNKKCLTALLNPKDDPEKYNSESYKCLKLEIAPNHCFVSDGLLYRAGLASREVMELYMKSIIPVESYIFGTYRFPECLVATTVIPGYVSLLDKRRDSPVLVNNSEELYINNLIESYKEFHPEFYDTLLYYFYLRLIELGKAHLIEDRVNRIAVFVDNAKGKPYTVRIPDVASYCMNEGAST